MINEEEIKQKTILIGQQVFNLCNLKMNKKGLISTAWGNKTIEGLGDCILTIVSENK